MLKHGRPNTSARTRRNPPRPDCSSACTAGILAQPFARPPLLFCFHTNGPQPACAWSVALQTHASAETNRAGRQSCVARWTRVTLLLLRPPHEWRELVVPGCTAALSHLLRQILRLRPPRAVAQLLFPISPRHIRHLCLRA
jgi:hypothetical protein